MSVKIKYHTKNDLNECKIYLLYIIAFTTLQTKLIKLQKYFNLKKLNLKKLKINVKIIF